MGEKVINYLKKHFDDLLIIGTMAEVMKNSMYELTDNESLVVSAIKRSTSELSEDSSTEEVRDYLLQYDDTQIDGLVSNVKGILHEIEFVEMENNDGDNVSAVIFPDSNHKAYDIQMLNTETEESWEVQLKATDSSSYVNQSIDEHGLDKDEIIVSSELAERMGLQSSGLSNEELTLNTSELIEKMRNNETPDFWNYFPYIGLASITLVVLELYKMYANNQISYDEFKYLVIKSTGIKAVKFAFILTLLSIPVVNVVTGAYLVANFLYSSSEYAKHWMNSTDKPSTQEQSLLVKIKH